MKDTVKVPGPNNVSLVLNTEDPETPALVYAGPVKQWERTGLGRYCSTYDCACGEGVVDDEVVLTMAQLEFLESEAIEAKVNATYEVARPEGWDR